MLADLEAPSERDGFGFVAFSHFCLTGSGDVTAGGTRTRRRGARAERDSSSGASHVYRLSRDVSRSLALV